MAVEFKVCGLTRATDAQLAAALGAAYLGFIFAASPRQLTVEQAALVMRALDETESAEPSRASSRPRRVGVFAGADASAITATVTQLALDVVQLHGVGDAGLVSALRDAVPVKIWTVVHVGADGVDRHALDGAALGDGILLDAKVDGMLGGTGRSFDWARERDVVEPLREGRSIILAGGLRTENVARAIAVFSPDVVDVSSGVESSPGIKDPARLRAFANAVHGVRSA